MRNLAKAVDTQASDYKALLINTLCGIVLLSRRGILRCRIDYGRVPHSRIADRRGALSQREASGDTQFEGSFAVFFQRFGGGTRSKFALESGDDWGG